MSFYITYKKGKEKIKHIILYPPIDREALEVLMENTAIAMSFKREAAGAFSIVARDTEVIRKYNMPHSVVNFTDTQKHIDIKQIKMYQL